MMEHVFVPCALRMPYCNRISWLLNRQNAAFCIRHFYPCVSPQKARYAGRADLVVSTCGRAAVAFLSSKNITVLQNPLKSRLHALPNSNAITGRLSPSVFWEKNAIQKLHKALFSVLFQQPAMPPGLALVGQCTISQRRLRGLKLKWDLIHVRICEIHVATCCSAIP